MSEHTVVFLEGKRVVLRPYHEETDLGYMVRWMNDQNILQFIGRIPFPLTKEQEQEALKKLSTQNDIVFLVIVEKDSNTPIGTMGLHHVDFRNGTATTGALIGETQFQGRGFGTDAKMTLLHYVFLTLGLRRVAASVLSSNHRSLAYMEKCGYKEVGRREAWYWRNGTYVDEIFTVVTREDFIPLWEKWQQT